MNDDNPNGFTVERGTQITLPAIRYSKKKKAMLSRVKAPVHGTPLIYFILESTEFVKVGWTSGHVADRLKSVQTGNPRLLKLVAWVPGSQKDEHWLHRRLYRSQKCGEWFRMSKRVKTVVDHAKKHCGKPEFWAGLEDLLKEAS